MTGPLSAPSPGAALTNIKKPISAGREVVPAPGG